MCHLAEVEDENWFLIFFCDECPATLHGTDKSHSYQVIDNNQNSI